MREKIPHNMMRTILLLSIVLPALLSSLNISILSNSWIPTYTITRQKHNCTSNNNGMVLSTVINRNHDTSSSYLYRLHGRVSDEDNEQTEESNVGEQITIDLQSLTEENSEHDGFFSRLKERLFGARRRQKDKHTIPMLEPELTEQSMMIQPPEEIDLPDDRNNNNNGIMFEEPLDSWKDHREKNGLQQLQDMIEEGLEKQSDDIIQAIAIESCKLVMGGPPWAVQSTTRGIAKRKTNDPKESPKSRQRTVAIKSRLSLISRGIATIFEPLARTMKKMKDGPPMNDDIINANSVAGIKDMIDEETKTNKFRLQWKQYYSTVGGYPLKSLQQVSLGDKVVIEYYGTIQFNFLTRQILFILDELTVFNTRIDLNKIMLNITNNTNK